MIVRLALGNVRKSLRDYAVYFVTIALGVAVFYAFNTLGQQSKFLSESTSQALELLSSIMGGLTWLLAVVLGFLMVYANNFLIRRRREEFGLYQVLGMTRGQVSAVMTVETLVASLGAFVAGLLLGILLSQFLVFVSAALFNDTVKQFRFIFSFQALAIVVVCFAVTFGVMLLFNLRTVRSVRLVQLMGSGRANESQRGRPLWLCVPLLAVSLALIVWAYVRLTADGLPVMLDDADAMTRFWITTALVTAGTFGLFWALPTVLINVQRRLPGIYLRGLRMFTDRQIASRVNSGSVAMAVTAMVLFLAMTSVSGGMSISAGLNMGLKRSAPFSASAYMFYSQERASASMDTETWERTLRQAGIDPQGVYTGDPEDPDSMRMAQATGPVDLRALLAQRGVDWEEVSSATAQADFYSQVTPGTVPTAASASTAPSADPLTLGDFMAYARGGTAGKALTDSLDRSLEVEPLSSYNATRKLLGMEPVELGPDTYLLTANVGSSLTEDVYDPALAAGLTFQLGGRTLHPARATCVTDASAALGDSPMGDNSGTVVVPDELVAGLPLSNSALQVMSAPGQEKALGQAFEDAWGTAEQRIVQNGYAVGMMTQMLTRAEAVAGSFTMTGLVGYMAVYIGFVLVVSCASVLAIQQLSGIADSRRRYRLLGDLGASQAMIDRSILAQVMFYFLAPLAVALCHSAVALRQVVDVVTLLAPLDVMGSVWLALVIFTVVYGGYLLVCYLLSRSTVARTVVSPRR